MTKTMKITYTAIFSAIAAVLMFFEFPLPFLPPFLEVDLSGVAILIGAFLFGIGPGIAIALIKSLIHLPVSSTMGVGELQDFLLLSLLVIVSVSIYKKNRTRKGALIGCLAGAVSMSLTAMLTNYLFIIPFYAVVMGMPLEAIFAMCAKVNPYITGMGSYLVLAVLPFNLIKCGLITLAVMLVYKKLSAFIKAKQFGHHHMPAAE